MPCYCRYSNASSRDELQWKAQQYDCAVFTVSARYRRRDHYTREAQTCCTAPRSDSWLESGVRPQFEACRWHRSAVDRGKASPLRGSLWCGSKSFLLRRPRAVGPLLRLRRLSRTGRYNQRSYRSDGRAYASLPRALVRPRVQEGLGWRVQSRWAGGGAGREASGVSGRLCGCDPWVT